MWFGDLVLPVLDATCRKLQSNVSTKIGFTSVPEAPSMKTKMNCHRSFVQHNYHDHSRVTLLGNEGRVILEDRCYPHPSSSKKHVLFPLKLHNLLEADALGDVISWQPHGRAFKIHKVQEFSEMVISRYFYQTQWASFRRQLNLYGFLRITQGRDKGAYYHELFLRGKDFLARGIIRQKVKGTMVKDMANPGAEPEFYSMPYVGFTSCCHAMIDLHPSEELPRLDDFLFLGSLSPMLTHSSVSFILPEEKELEPIEDTVSDSSMIKLHGTGEATFEEQWLKLLSSPLSEPDCLAG